MPVFIGQKYFPEYFQDTQVLDHTSYDMEQEGRIAIWHATAAWDPKRAKFSTVAWVYCFHAFRRIRERDARRRRVPLPYRDWVNANEEQRAAGHSMKTCTAAGFDGLALEDLAVDPYPSHVEDVVAEDTIQTLYNLAESQFTPLQRALMRDRHLHRLSLQEIGAKYGISRQRVSRVLLTAARRIRDSLMESPNWPLWEEFLESDNRCRRKIIRPGDRFGSLTIRDRVCFDAGAPTRWRCECECGGKVVAFPQDLRAGLVTNCGECNTEVAA